MDHVKRWHDLTAMMGAKSASMGERQAAASARDRLEQKHPDLVQLRMPPRNPFVAPGASGAPSDLFEFARQWAHVVYDAVQEAAHTHAASAAEDTQREHVLRDWMERTDGKYTSQSNGSFQFRVSIPATVLRELYACEDEAMPGLYLAAVLSSIEDTLRAVLGVVDEEDEAAAK